jgi:CRISPR-associated protein Cmr4
MANTRIYWLHTLSPTHIGTGRGVGYIDLPIHRDKVTNWPVIPGSAFKGVWTDHFRATKENRQTDRKLRLAFGVASDEGQNQSNAGALIPTDARLVSLPVRSFQGTFAWCTSSLSLKMLHRDLTLSGMPDLPSAPDGLEEGVAHHGEQTLLKEGDRIYLEDLDLRATECFTATAWAKKIAGWVFPEDANWQTAFIKRFAVLPDVVYDFLTETGTEVTARVKIDDDLKTVVEGQLWNEEALPAETILVGLVSCDRVYAKDADGITEQALLEKYATDALTLQIGGKATVGRGRVRCVFTPVAGGDHANP